MLSIVTAACGANNEKDTNSTENDNQTQKTEEVLVKK